MLDRSIYSRHLPSIASRLNFRPAPENPVQMSMTGDHRGSSEELVCTDSDRVLSWIILVTLGAVALFLATKSSQIRKFKKSAVLNLPPGPRNWPLVGAIPELSSPMHKAFQKFAQRYGPIVYFRLGFHHVVLVSDSESAEELLRSRDAEFCDRAGHSLNRTAGKYLGFESTLFVFSDNDALLKARRKVTMSELFTVAKLKTYEDLRRQEMAVMVEKMWNTAENNCNASPGTTGSTSQRGSFPVLIGEASAAAVQNILFKLCLGTRFDDLAPTDNLRKFPEISQEFVDLFMRFNLVDFFPFLERLDPQGLMKVFQNCGERQSRLYERIIEEKKQARKLLNRSDRAPNTDADYVSNFVDVLLDLQEEDPNMSDSAVMATLMTMLVAGIDTSSTAVEWTLLELVRNPHHLWRIQQEMDTIVGKDRQVQEPDLKAMPFFNAVVMESLRLHPGVAFSPPHTNKAPSSLGGYYIPANTAVFVDIYSHGRDPKLWKEPLQFNPERFMSKQSPESAEQEDLSGIKVNGTDFRLLPFSSGRRMCAGQTLAQVLVSLMVGTLVHAFEWRAPVDSDSRAWAEDENVSLVLHPSPRLAICPRPRLPAHVYSIATHV